MTPGLLLACVLWMAASGCDRAAHGQTLLAQAVRAHEAALSHPADATPEQSAAAVQALQRVAQRAAGTVWAAKAEEAIGALHLARREFALAREQFTRLVWYYPEAREVRQMAQVSLGRAYEGEGLWEAAADSYQDLAYHLSWSPIWLEAPLYPAQMHERRGDAEAAAAAYRDAVRTYLQRVADAPAPPLEVRALAHLALAARRGGLQDRADRALSRLTEIGERADRPETLLELGRAWETLLGDGSKAEAAYATLEQAFPTHPLAHTAKDARQRLADSQPVPSSPQP